MSGFFIDKYESFPGGLSKSYEKECFFEVSSFLEHKGYGGVVNHQFFLGLWGSGKVQHC